MQNLTSTIVLVTIIHRGLCGLCGFRGCRKRFDQAAKTAHLACRARTFLVMCFCSELSDVVNRGQRVLGPNFCSARCCKAGGGSIRRNTDSCRVSVWCSGGRGGSRWQAACGEEGAHVCCCVVTAFWHSARRASDADAGKSRRQSTWRHCKLFVGIGIGLASLQVAGTD